MPNLLRNQSVIFFAIAYEISKSVIPLSNSVIINLVIGFEVLKNSSIGLITNNQVHYNTVGQRNYTF